MQSQVFLKSVFLERKTNYKGLVKKWCIQSAGSKGSTIIKDTTEKEENIRNIITPDATDLQRHFLPV